jgi:hypothetical protein
VISRYLVILLALGVGVFQASRGNYVEALGLFGLSGGLAILRFGPQPYRRAAYLCFALTAVAVVVVFARRY